MTKPLKGEPLSTGACGNLAPSSSVRGRFVPRRHCLNQLIPHRIHHPLRIVQPGEQIRQLLGREGRVGHDEKM
jgi:hypothetical protein